LEAHGGADDPPRFSGKDAGAVFVAEEEDEVHSAIAVTLRVRGSGTMREKGMR
jgi:hypothetical protein